MNKNRDLINFDDEDEIEFDFGFTEKSAEEVDIGKKKADDYKIKLEKSMKLTLTFLNNLKKNPEKEYLYWPDRSKKVDEFIKKLKSITE